MSDELNIIRIIRARRVYNVMKPSRWTHVPIISTALRLDINHRAITMIVPYKVRHSGPVNLLVTMETLFQPLMMGAFEDTYKRTEDSLCQQQCSSQ